METSYRAVGYRRVSMRDQVDGFSLDAQVTHIKTFVEAQGWQLLEFYTDAGISAKKGSRRPALEQLLKDAREGKFDVVVVDKIDRFYRHLGGLLTALDQLNSCGVAFASVQEKLDFTTPWGKLMLTVLGMLAEIYIENLRQETRKGQKQRARQGLWLGSVPFGYCNGLCSKCTDPNGMDYCPSFGEKDQSDGKRLIAHPIDGEVVGKVFDWYKTGEMSTARIAERLNNFEVSLLDGQSVQPRQKGGPGRTEPGPFTRDVIRDILRREAYTGSLPYQGMDKDGRHPKRKQANEIFQGAQPALIDQDTYDQVKQIRELLAFNPRSRNGSTVQVYPLTGVLKCGYCGNNMRGDSSYQYRYYQDASRIERVARCMQDSVRAEGIEKQAYRLIDSALTQANGGQAMDLVQSQVDEAESRFARAKELYLSGEIGREEYERELNRLNRVKKDLQYDQLNAIIASTHYIQSRFRVWTELSQMEQKRLLQLALEAAWLRESKLVAVKPTVAFLPLLGEGFCNCGIDPRPPRSLC